MLLPSQLPSLLRQAFLLCDTVSQQNEKPEMNYFLVADKLLRKLSKEFGVPTPSLHQVEPSNDRYGCYWNNQIFLGSDTLRNLHLTVKVTKHEFAHYLEDRFNLDTKGESKAKNFEKNILALDVLPKNQTKLGVASKNKK